jgi:hypothetical protein
MTRTGLSFSAGRPKIWFRTARLPDAAAGYERPEQDLEQVRHPGLVICSGVLCFLKRNTRLAKMITRNARLRTAATGIRFLADPYRKGIKGPPFIERE